MIQIEYLLQRSNRKTISLQISKEGEVFVKAPLRVSKKSIDNFVLSKEAWIEKRKKIQKARIKLDFGPGDKIYWYQNQQYQIIREQSKSYKVQTKIGSIFLKGPDISFEKLDRHLYIWEKHQIMERIEGLWQSARINFPELQRFRVEFKYRRLKSRWGSCSSKGLLTFNTRLIHIQPECLEVVFWHEVSHLFQANHSSRFYDKLAYFYPNYKVDEKKLKAWSLR